MNMITVTVTMTPDTYEMNGLKHRRWRGRTAGGLEVDLLVQSIRPLDESGERPLMDELGIDALQLMPAHK
jgi:hypothetical protein